MKLPIQRLHPSAYEKIEDQLMSFFRESIYEPLVRILREVTLQAKDVFNSHKNIVRDALLSGRIQYSYGTFSGRFNAQIGLALRALGARFDKVRKIYKLAMGKVPDEVKSCAVLAAARAEIVRVNLELALDDMQKNLDRAIEQKNVDTTEMQESFEKGFRSAAEAIKIDPKLSQASREKLHKEYNENLKIHIKSFTRGQVGDLRRIVEGNAQEGLRFDSLIEKIQSRYQTSKTKAKFLARQETSLFMSKFRQRRFSEAGVQKYEWSANPDERTRDDHRKLSGRIFLYADPPVTDSATGQRNNPGEDFNCRCVDIPILEQLGV